MLMDAFLTTTNLAGGAALTTLSAATAAFSDVIDLSTSRDISTSHVPAFVVFSVAPTSGTGGATINIAIQTSADNSTWVTLEETAAQPIANITAGEPFAFRGWLNAGVLRYLRFAYTASAVLTAGSVTASLGADWPRTKAYPKNYVA
jgi:hypothetical protein